MSKTLPVTGMIFSNRDDNYNECLNTKIEKVFKTCRHPLAFTLIRTVCCSEKIKFLKKKNVIQLKRLCAIKVIPVTLIIIIRVIAVTSKTEYYMLLKLFHIAHDFFK